MPLVDGSYINPFYQQVDKEVAQELNTRATFYGSRVRSTRSGAYEKGLAWTYQRKSWARVKSIDPQYTLGMAGSKLMSNRDGDLTLYNAQRFVPNKALLQSLELSNEGTIGSLMKGKFTFTLYPKMTTQGFEIDLIERAFFTPGGEVEISWGWSVSANNSRSNHGKFRGIIYNFNWSVNGDLSITADCSIVSAATTALGHSGDLNTKKDDLNPPANVLGSPIPGPNLAAVIDRDLTTPGFSALATLAVGTAGGPVPGVEGLGLPGSDGRAYIPEYWAIGLPHQEVEPETNAPAPAGTPGSSTTRVTAPPPPVPKTYFYIKLGVVVDFINRLISTLEATNGVTNEIMSKLFRVQVWENFSAYNPVCKSAYPFDVFFPDDQMGFYGPACTPYPNAAMSPLRAVPDGKPVKPGDPIPMSTTDIALGNILLGTDFVKNTYKEFIEENSANIPHKNISSFFESIIKKINEASGDMYQLALVQFDRRDFNFTSPSSPGVGFNSGAKGGDDNRSMLSIEDTLLSETVTSKVQPYEFGVNIFKPLIKTASISCKPPAAMATAAYASARSTGNGPAKPETGLKPNNAAVDVTPTDKKDKAAFDKERLGENGDGGAFKDIFAKAYAGSTSGFNNSWGEQMRGSLVAYKKNATETNDGKGSNHWLNQAAYPIDLTLTIDGINGFKFGDVIRTTAIPKRYNTDWDMVFTVTKISHKIDSSTWETTLNTKARINMNPKASQKRNPSLNARP